MIFYVTKQECLGGGCFVIVWMKHNSYKAYQNKGSDQRFNYCMSTLNDAHQQVQLREQQQQQPKNPDTVVLFHALWMDGPLLPTAKLGLLSLLLNHTMHQVHLYIWTTNPSTQIDLELKLSPYF
jgi:hypothetical protein